MEGLTATVHGAAKSDMTGRLHFHFSFHCGEDGSPFQCSLENPRDSGAKEAAVCGVLKRSGCISERLQQLQQQQCMDVLKAMDWMSWSLKKKMHMEKQQRGSRALACWIGSACVKGKPKKRVSQKSRELFQEGGCGCEFVSLNELNEDGHHYLNHWPQARCGL